MYYLLYAPAKKTFVFTKVIVNPRKVHLMVPVIYPDYFKWFGPTLLTLQTRSVYLHSTRLTEEALNLKRGTKDEWPEGETGCDHTQDSWWVNTTTLTSSFRHDDEDMMLFGPRWATHSSQKPTVK